MTTIEIATLPGFMLRKGKFGPPDTLWLTHQHATIAPLAEVMDAGYFDQLISDASVHPLDHIKVVSTANDRVETIEVLVTEKIANIDAANGVGSVTVQIVGVPVVAAPSLDSEPGEITAKWNNKKRVHEVLNGDICVIEFKDRAEAEAMRDRLIGEREAA